MSFLDWLEYTLVNFSAAAAIALDACILVILKFRIFSTQAVALRWAGAVGLTHVLFPMVGFIGGWIIIQKYHLAPIVYSLGAVLLGILISLIISEAVNPHPEAEDISDKSTSDYTKFLHFWIPVLSVSLDALLSGPGKTVMLERYPKQLAWLSFVLVGLLVALFTLIAGVVSRRLHGRWITGRLASPVSLAQGITGGIVGEFVLFSFFLVWCIAKSIDHIQGFAHITVSFSYVILAGIILGGTISAVFLRKINAAQLVKAKLAMTTTD